MNRESAESAVPLLDSELDDPLSNPSAKQALHVALSRDSSLHEKLTDFPMLLFTLRYANHDLLIIYSLLFTCVLIMTVTRTMLEPSMSLDCPIFMHRSCYKFLKQESFLSSRHGVLALAGGRCRFVK